MPSQIFPTYRLGDIAQFVNGYAFAASDWHGEGVPIVRIQNLHDSNAAFNLTQAVVDTKFHINNGDLLLSWAGSLVSIDVYIWNKGRAYLNQHLFRVEENDSLVDRRYLYYALRQTLDTLRQKVVGATNQIHIRRGLLEDHQILLPPLEEQRRIVARVEALAARIEEARGLRRAAMGEAEILVDITRASIFREALEGTTARLDSVATLERGRFSHRPRNDPHFFGGAHPWIQIAEIEASGKYIQKWSETLNDEGLTISRKFPKGTVLVSIAATIGAVGILDFDCCIPDSIVAITPQLNIDSSYIYHYLGYLRSHLEQLAPQSAQKNINLEILSPLPIPALSLEEQRRIVAYLDELQAKAEALRRLQAESAAELEALLPSVLDQAFRGAL